MINDRTRRYSGLGGVVKTEAYGGVSGGTQAYGGSSEKTQAYGSEKTVRYGVERADRTDRTEAHNLGVGDRVELNGKEYEILEIVSGERESGEAVIYKARDSEGKVYALKLYYSFRDPRDEPNPEALTRIKMIKDPDILRLYDFGMGANKYRGKFCFEVCQYAAGGNLLSVPDLKEKYTIEFLSSHVIPEIFKGIRTLHDYKIYHCDLKPENVYYLDEEQTDLIIGDYGSSKTFEETSDKELAHTTTTKGTEFYLAPEQARGIVSEKNDYYSFGMILLHLVYPQYVNRESLHKIIERQFARKPIIDFDPEYGRINDLIAGLTLYDIGCRWGEEEVKGWLRGEEVEVNYRGRAEVQVQPINLGKAVIRSVEDLTGYIEEHDFGYFGQGGSEWYLDLIEDREGYALLLRWVADLQGLDRKKVFDKMVRTYQQDGEEFLKEAVLRYFTPQRSVRVDMKEYDFWGTEDIEGLAKEFFKHLDDIWKITDIGKLKFYLFQFEFVLRQMEQAAEGKAGHLIRSILEKISSTLSVPPKEGFDDYICIFYPELNDEKLLKLFYAFDEDRAFRDLEGKSYRTLEEVGLFFAKNREAYNEKRISKELCMFLQGEGKHEYVGLKYEEFLFKVFEDKIRFKLEIHNVLFGKPSFYSVQITYTISKSLRHYFVKHGIHNDILSQVTNTFIVLNLSDIKEDISAREIVEKFIKRMQERHELRVQNMSDDQYEIIGKKMAGELELFIKREKEEIGRKVNMILEFQKSYQRLWREVGPDGLATISKEEVDRIVEKIPSYWRDPRFHQLEELQKLAEEMLLLLKNILIEDTKEIESHVDNAHLDGENADIELKESVSFFFENPFAFLTLLAYVGVNLALMIRFRDSYHFLAGFFAILNIFGVSMAVHVASNIARKRRVKKIEEICKKMSEIRERLF